MPIIEADKYKVRRALRGQPAFASVDELGGVIDEVLGISGDGGGPSDAALDMMGLQKSSPSRADIAISSMVSRGAAGAEQEGVESDLGFFESIQAGYQASIAGLSVRGDLPSVSGGSFFDQFVSGLTQYSLDSPFYVAGGFAGALAGSGVASIPLAGAGAFALPELIRQTLIESYSSDIENFEQFWDRSLRIGKATGKEGIVGALVAPLGVVSKPFSGAVGGIARRSVGRVVTGGADSLVAQGAESAAKKIVDIGVTASGLTGFGAAVNGEIPTAEDFARNTALVSGIVLGGKVTAPVRNKIGSYIEQTFIKTGASPDVIANSILNDISILHDSLSKEGELPRAWRGEPTREYVDAKLEGKEAELYGEAEDGRTDSGLSPSAESTAKRAESILESKESRKEIDPLDEAKAGVAFDIPKGKISVKQVIQRFYRDWFRQPYFLDNFVTMAKKDLGQKELSVLEDPSKLLQLEAGINSIAHASLIGGVRSLKTGEVLSDGIRGTLIEAAKTPEQLERFGTYLVVRRQVEIENGRAEKLVESGMSRDQAIEEVYNSPVTKIPSEVARRALESGREEFESHAKKIDEHNRAILQVLAETGVLSEMDMALLEASGKNYIPLSRVFEDTSDPLGRRDGGGKRAALLRLKGDENLRVMNPFESLVANTYMLHRVAARAQVERAFIDLAERSWIPGVIERVKTKPRKTRVSEEEIRRAIEKFSQGKRLDESEQSILEQFAEESFDIFRPQRRRLRDNEIEILDPDGSRRIYRVDKDIYSAFETAGSGNEHVVMSVARRAAQIKRAGDILNPDFITRNPVRDVFTAFILSDSKFKFLIDSGQGLWSEIVGNKLAKEFEASGAGRAGMLSLEREYLQSGVADLVRKGFFDHAINAATHPLQTFHLLASITENASRIGAFGRTLKGEKGSILDIDFSKVTFEQKLNAAIEGRNVTLDFAIMGLKARAVNQVIPFFSATLNGADRMVRSLISNPVRTMSRITSSVILPSIALHLYNRDKDWYKRQPRWMKDLFWLIKIGDYIIRIPKPFEIGVIFGTGAERIVDWLIGRDPSAFDGYIKTALSSVTPSFMPALSAPFIEHAFGRLTFFDRPLIPQKLERFLPELQANPNTTGIAKLVASGVSRFESLRLTGFASPIVLENYVRGFTGGLGITILRALDSITGKLGITELSSPRGPDGWRSLPGVRGFFARNISMSAEPIDDFYMRYDNNERVINSLDMLITRGEVDRYNDLVQRYGLESTVSLRRYREAISGYLKTVDMIWDDRLDMPRSEKTQLSDSYVRLAVMTAESALQYIESIKRMGREEAIEGELK